MRSDTGRFQKSKIRLKLTTIGETAYRCLHKFFAVYLPLLFVLEDWLVIEISTSNITSNLNSIIHFTIDPPQLQISSYERSQLKVMTLKTQHFRRKTIIWCWYNVARCAVLRYAVLQVTFSTITYWCGIFCHTIETYLYPMLFITKQTGIEGKTIIF